MRVLKRYILSILLHPASMLVWLNRLLLVVSFMTSCPCFARRFRCSRPPPALSAQLAAMGLGMTTTVRRPQCQLVFWGNRFSTTASPSVQLVMLVLDMTASILILVRLIRLMLFLMLCLPWTVFRPSGNITSVIHFNIMILVTTLSLVFWFMAVMCHPAYLINLALLGVFSRQMKPQVPTQFLRTCFLVMSGLVNFACAKCPVMSIIFIEVACSPSRCCRS